ncbi:MAG: hypothetical protein AB7P49_14060 [Bdellovibrionales bacterium]
MPLEKSWGVEAIMYASEFDFALVRGLGRVGAAISPTNSEETFFGHPGFEIPPEFLERMRDKKKYESQKITLAGAFGLWGNKKHGLRRVQINLGAIGKYNTETDSVWPGAGVSAVVGPFTLGYSVGQDETLIDMTDYGLENEKFRYNSETFSAGIYMNSLALDYSYVRITASDLEPIHVSLLTGSVLLRRWILTIAGRREASERPAYDFKTQTLVAEDVKRETFGGVQFAATRFLMIGCFHNYYLLREISIGAILFF